MPPFSGIRDSHETQPGIDNIREAGRSDTLRNIASANLQKR